MNFSQRQCDSTKRKVLCNWYARTLFYPPNVQRVSITIAVIQPFSPAVTICTARVNIKKYYVLPTQCIYVFCKDFRTNSDYFTIQNSITGLFATETGCVYCVVRTEPLNRIQVNLSLYIVNSIYKRNSCAF
jgi:hypothetical protein